MTKSFVVNILNKIFNKNTLNWETKLPPKKWEKELNRMKNETEKNFNLFN